MEATLTKMAYIKQENECCCCFSKEDLFNMFEPYNFHEKIEVYSIMIAECFQIKFNSNIEECSNHLYSICKHCVFRLRDAVEFRSRVQNAYDRLQVSAHIYEHCSKQTDTTANIIQNCGVSLENNDDMNVEIKKEFDSENVVELKPFEFLIKDECSEMDVADDVADIHESITQDCDYAITPRKLDNGNSLVLRPLEAILKKNVKGVVEDITIISTESHLENLQNTNDEKSYKFSGTDRFLCNFCNRIFKSLIRLQMHMVSHENEDSFVCYVCKEEFRYESSLSHHMLTHSEDYDKKCGACGKYFLSKASLADHINADHSDKLSCDCCDETFENIYVLRNHLELRLNENGLICKVCGASSKSVRAFKVHASKHKNEGINRNDRHNFVCNICKRAFKLKAWLKRHKQKNTCVKNRPQTSLVITEVNCLRTE